jgi:hypothetical protein
MKMYIVNHGEPLNHCKTPCILYVSNMDSYYFYDGWYPPNDNNKIPNAVGNFIKELLRCDVIDELILPLQEKEIRKDERTRIDKLIAFTQMQLHGKESSDFLNGMAKSRDIIRFEGIDK